MLTVGKAFEIPGIRKNSSTVEPNAETVSAFEFSERGFLSEALLNQSFDSAISVAQRDEAHHVGPGIKRDLN